MAGIRTSNPRWRLRWREMDRLTLALIVSLVLHGAIFGGYQANKKFGLFRLFQWPTWLQKVQQKLTASPPKKNPDEQMASEPPLLFVQVSPAVVTPEPPKNPKYYSSQSSKAANPESELDSNVPKLDGEQQQLVKTDDVPRSKAFPLQPSAPKSQEKPQEEEKQKRSEPSGNLTVAKAAPVLHNEDGQSTKSRPRTIVEAKMRQQANPLAGQKMKQEGGVKRNQLVPSLDVKGTTFGAYDEALIRAVQNRWYDLLDDRNFAGERTGRVAVQFNLHPDGRVSDLKVLENTVDELLALLCQKAIMDPAPFDKWPTQMRMQIGDVREIKFTFYYN